MTSTPKFVAFMIGTGATLLAMSTPAPAAPSLSPNQTTAVQSVSSLAYEIHGTSAVLKNGTVDCWGDNAFGQLGNGNDTSSDVPVAVKGIYGITHVVGNPGSYCAVLNSGAVYCWGYNSGQYGNGVLGDGSSAASSNVPVKVRGLSGAISLVSDRNGYGDNYGYCALLSTGHVKCWGSQDALLGGGLAASGLLGDGGQETFSNVPVTVAGISTAIGLVSGQGGYCALLRSSAVECWGDNEYDELGDGHMGDLSGAAGTADAQESSGVPVPVKGLLNAASVVSDWYGYCALLSNGKVRCWGNNSFGELGDGSKANTAANYGSDVAVPVTGLAGVVRLAATDYGYCALLSHGNVKCWGSNSLDELGDGMTSAAESNSDTPKTVVGVGNAVSLAGSYSYAFSATLRSGLVKCWGDNGFGQLGADPAAESSDVAFTVSDLTGAASVGANGANAGWFCAVLSNGGAACWGDNSSDQLGAGPFPVPSAGAVRVDELGPWTTSGPHPSTPNIVIDGDLVVPGVLSYSYKEVPAGSTEIAGWAVGGGGVVAYGSSYLEPPPGATTATRLVGTTPGSITQSITTTAGQRYLVRWYGAGDPGGSQAVKVMDVSWDGKLVDAPTYNSTGRTTSAIGWSARYVVVTARSVSSSLEFADATPGKSFWGSLLGEVSLQELPQ